jgi:DNA (cytosine-5)-methyltransferase 1
MLRRLDLFSGIGGFSLAAQWVGGIETTQFVEINPFCQKVLTKNFPGVPIYDDIAKFTANAGDYDLITAGFPCQPHSEAGKRKASEDDRDLNY